MHVTDGQVDAVEQGEDRGEHMHDIQGGDGPDDDADGSGQAAVLHLGGQQADDHPGQKQAQEDAEAVIGPVKMVCGFRANQRSTMVIMGLTNLEVTTLVRCGKECSTRGCRFRNLGARAAPSRRPRRARR